MIHKVIIVDDDPINNFICREVIKSVNPNVEIIDFTCPLEGLKYITENHKQDTENGKTILFLDLNMSLMTGWEFLEEFKKRTNVIQNPFTVYILSSSVNEKDKDRATENPGVTDMVVKPLNPDIVKSILN